MMDQKTLLTRKILEQLGIQITEKSFKDWYRLWWQNPRETGSMRLTDRGLEDFEQKAGFKSYKIDFPQPLDTVTNQFILDLEHFIGSPYYLTRKHIVVFTEKLAVQLVLFGGDLQKYNKAKTMSQKYNTKSA